MNKMYNWKEINSDEFKHQWYYDQKTTTFSWIEKEPELCDLIQQYDATDRLINTYRSIAHAVKSGFESPRISPCINHPEKYKTYKGFIWKKLENQKPIPKTIEEIEEELGINIVKGHCNGVDTTITMRRKDGSIKKVRLHRLLFYINNELTITRCEKCEDDPSIFCVFDTKHHIDHINGIHEDDRPDNLQRLCPSCHAIKTNKQTRANGTRKSSERSVKINVYKNEEKDIFKTYNSMKECHKDLGISHAAIRKSMDTKKSTQKIKGNKYLFEDAVEKIDGEIWKDINPLVDQKGQCSNKGRIRTGQKIITYGHGLEKNGYMIVSHKPVHISIAMTFLAEEYEKKVLEIQEKFPNVTVEEIKNSTGKPYSVLVDHIDRNKKNNRLDNLRWVSYKENSLNQDSVKEVEQWTLDGKTLVNTFKSQSEACEKLGLSSSQLSMTISGKKGRKQAGGFIFKFKEDGVTSVDAVQTDAEKSLDIFIPHFENFKQFLIDNNRKPYRRKDGFLGSWYENINHFYKNKSACMSFETVYTVWDEFVNRKENREYFLDWNDTWTINFNKINDMDNLSEEERKKLKTWIQHQNSNYKNRSKSMSTKNQAQYDLWTDIKSTKNMFSN